MSYFLPHLPSGWHVDQAILAEENRVVIIRFGHDWVRVFGFVLLHSHHPPVFTHTDAALQIRNGRSERIIKCLTSVVEHMFVDAEKRETCE
jgi:hypothetical protein